MTNRPELTASMREKLQKWTREHKPKYEIIDSNNETIPKDMLDGLKALGYIQ